MNATDLFKDILTTFKNDFDPETDGETIKRHFNRLMRFGEPLAVKAMQRYLVSSTSSFFDWSELVNCLKEEVATDLRIPTKESAWEIITTQIKQVGGSQKPQLGHTLVLDAVNSIGGWQHICNSGNLSIERANFNKVYIPIRSEFLNNVVLGKWEQV